MSNYKYSDLCAGKGVAASTLRRKKKKKQKQNKTDFFLAFADFCGVNTPTMISTTKVTSLNTELRRNMHN